MDRVRFPGSRGLSPLGLWTLTPDEGGRVDREDGGTG